MSDPTPMITLTIDGQTVTVPKGTTVYTAAQQIKADIPVFCYLDRMPPFGACRMCLVEVEKSPKLQTSCTLEATEGMVVRTQSDPALEGRKEILELLLINHPLDCPICDKGGECPLQDHTMKYGPGKSAFYEDKRRFDKHMALSPVLMLDRERCIVCARCTRFGELISGDQALQFINRGYETEVGTADGKPARSKFIGNTIKICPVGALTSRVYRFKARPWDNKTTESTCTLCPVGCSMAFDQRDGNIDRTRSVENTAVNDIWLCDKGWFGYQFVQSEERLQYPLIRKNGALVEATWDEAISLIASHIASVKGQGKLGGMGGTPLTTEELHLFQQFLRTVVGVDNVDYRAGLPITPDWGGMETPIADCEKLDFAILFGIDLTEEFPVIWLRLKQALNKGAKVLYFGNYAPEIANQLTDVILHAPGEELEILSQHLPKIAEMKGSGALFVGQQYLANSSGSAILQNLSEFHIYHPSIALNVLDGHGNSMGARFAGMLPTNGLNWIEMLDKTAKEGWDFLYVVGSNVAEKVPKAFWKTVRQKLGFLVVQDLFLTETAQDADVVLPTLCYAEKSGTFHNIEGRAEKLNPGRPVPDDIFSDGEIFIWLARLLKTNLGINHAFSQFLSQKIATPKIIPELSSRRSPQSPTNSGLRLCFAPKLFDNGVRMRHNPQLSEMCDEAVVSMNATEAGKRNLTCGETVSLQYREGTISAKLRVSPDIANGTLVVPLGFKSIPTQEWGINVLNGVEINVLKGKS
jgi:NADH-quinone oxidoreductase subunit G